MTIFLDIINNTDIYIDRVKLEGVIEKVLEEKGLREPVELALLLVDQEEMKKLHKKYMGTDEVTDVLSFPLDEAVFPDGIRRPGDIVICTSVARKQAAENGRTFDDETAFLTEHGLRHLLGEHHE